MNITVGIEIITLRYTLKILTLDIMNRLLKGNQRMQISIMIMII
jgi:hypothetical protein